MVRGQYGERAQARSVRKAVVKLQKKQDIALALVRRKFFQNKVSENTVRKHVFVPAKLKYVMRKRKPGVALRRVARWIETVECCCRCLQTIHGVKIWR